MGILGKLFGAENIIASTFKAIDDIHYSDSEEAEDKRKAIETKTKAKVELIGAYAPFKIAQRYLALIFTFLFAFIMLNGILGSLYGFVDLDKVEQAKEFANSMWLGEIMLAIISFYFGGGFIESIKRKN